MKTDASANDDEFDDVENRKNHRVKASQVKLLGTTENARSEKAACDKENLRSHDMLRRKRERKTEIYKITIFASKTANERKNNDQRRKCC